MLIEKYMNIESTNDSGEIEYMEVEVLDSDIRHYIDTFLSAEDVLNYAKQISPEQFTDKNSADLDLAYDILINEFDEHDDIEDISELNDYIQECVNNDYRNNAQEEYDDIEDEIEYEDLI